MKIGVVADTHCHDIPRQLLNDFKSVDLIVHAGDFCTLAEVSIFKKLNKVVGVSGNMDDAGIRNKFPEKQIFEFEGFQFGLYHGAGPKEKVLNDVQKAFVKNKVDVVIYGHTHIALNQTIEGVLYFNPGSPNDLVIAPYCSYGILEIKSGKIVGKIVKIKD